MPYSLYTREYQLFVQMLVQARKAAALSQVELAQRLGKPQSFVSKCENCERRVDMAEFLAMAQVLGLDAAAFVQRYQADRAALMSAAVLAA